MEVGVHYGGESKRATGLAPRGRHLLGFGMRLPLRALRAHLVTEGQQRLNIQMVAPKAPEKFPLPILSTFVPFVKQPFEWEIHGCANLATFCCLFAQLGAIVCVSLAIFAKIVVR